MKRCMNVVMWVLAIFMAVGALVYIPSAASIIMFLFAVIAAPINPLQSFFKSKGLSGVIKGVLLTVLFFVSIALAPTSRNQVTENDEKKNISNDMDRNTAVSNPIKSSPSSTKQEKTEKESIPNDIDKMDNIHIDSVKNDAKKKEKTLDYNYDLLQKLFLEISADFAIEDLELYISDNSLFYSLAEYNKSGGGKSVNYVVAYTEGSAAQKYADSGDHVEVTFDKSNENHIMTAEYVNSSSISYSALFYNYGIWFDLMEEEPSIYSGYYINDSFAKEDGLTIVYSNGRKKISNYFPCDSSEDAIKKVLEKISDSSSEEPSHNSTKNSKPDKQSKEIEEKISFDNENDNSFNTYDNEKQQQTSQSWVLNTNSMKIHYPSCREVKKIAHHNYSTSSLSEADLISQGYTTCGVCH